MAVVISKRHLDGRWYFLKEFGWLLLFLGHFFGLLLISP